MRWNKLARALLFPPVVLMILLIPVATVGLSYCMAFMETDSALAIASYVLAFYTLTVWCARIPSLIRYVKAFKNENKYARRWLSDTQLRVNTSLYGSLAFNAVYAVFQLWLGFYHRSFWFCSLAGYYLVLAVMRFFLVRYTRKFKPGEQRRMELKKYRACGWVFLVMNLVLTLMIFFMVYWNRTFHHHEITTIAMAAYTFASFAMAIVSIVKYRKYQSPVYSASKVISLAAACVSMLTLESTMLTTFGQSEGTAFRRIMLATTGAAVSAFVIVMAAYMIVQSTSKLKILNKEDNQNG